MSDIQEIKSRIDLVRYIERFVPLKKAGRHYKACCPFHQENTPSFMVDADRQSWRCYGACAEGGDLFAFAMKQNGWTFTEALDELAREAGVQLTRQTRTDDSAQKERIEHLKGIVAAAASIFSKNLDLPEAAPVREYLERRGLSHQTISRYQIGYARAGWQNMLNEMRQIGYSDDDLVEVGLVARNDRGRVYDTFRNRLIVTIHDERGAPIGFGARTLTDEHPKYINSPESLIFHKSNTLYGLHVAKDAARRAGEAVIVEGYMDVLKAHQAGFLNVVAQMGTATTEQQLKTLSPRITKRIIIALDGDAAGQNASRRSLEAAQQVLTASYTGSSVIDVRIMELPEGDDPDDIISRDREEWVAYTRRSKTAIQYVIDAETRDLDPNASVQEREAIAKRIIPFLRSPDPLYNRANMINLAVRLRLPEFALAERMKQGVAKSEAKTDEQALRLIPRNEAQTILIYCEEPTQYFRVNRRLAELGIQKLKPHDFGDERAAVALQLFLEALETNEDPKEFISNYDYDLMQLVQASAKPPGDGIGYQYNASIAFTVKVSAINREIEDTQLRSREDEELDLLEQMMRLVNAKNTLMSSAF